MKATLAALSFALGSIAVSPPATAQEPITLRFAYTGGQTSVMWRNWLDAWVRQVETDAGSSLKIQPFFSGSLANMMNSYDRTVTGVADIAWGVSNSMTGKLRSSTVVELPSDFTSREASGAMWRLLEQGLISAEWSEVRPLKFFIYPASTAHFIQPVKKLEDLKGLKVATVSKSDSDIYQLLGAAPVTTAATELYEVVNRRVASGLVVGWAALQSFKLHEVTSYHLKFEGGCGAGFIIMNKESYARLPEGAKRAFDRNAGYEASKGVGAVIDRSFNDTEEFLKALAGHTVAALEPGEKQRWLKAIQPVADQWVKDTPNGATILEAFRAEVAKIKETK